MQKFVWNKLSSAQKRASLTRPAGLTNPQIATRAEEIMQEIRNGGDEALLRFTRFFDAPKIKHLRVSLNDCRAAWEALPAQQKHALQIAKGNIERFHALQMPRALTVDTQTGVTCQRLPRPLTSAGLYVPGGTAPLVSTLLMLAIPAKLAGVERRVVVTPPQKSGHINSAILAAAYLCDVTDIFACGGAQAIAALTFGTQSIPACAKIFGPGNAYVAAAKALAAQIAGGPAIDLPAGPSEAMIIADKSANPAFIASDLLSQAEHDELAQLICVAQSGTLADDIIAQMQKQISHLPRRDIASAALETSRLIITKSRKDWLEIINEYAPEHLILHVEDAEALLPDIINAGSVFLGPWTPESMGDYASGTNHTLPTGGAARSYSGVSLDSFFKFITVQTLTPQGLRELGPVVMTLAQMEGLDAHRRAVSIRLEELET